MVGAIQMLRWTPEMAEAHQKKTGKKTASEPVRVKVVVASVDSCCQRFSLRIQPYFLLPAPVSRLA